MDRAVRERTGGSAVTTLGNLEGWARTRTLYVYVSVTGGELVRD